MSERPGEPVDGVVVPQGVPPSSARQRRSFGPGGEVEGSLGCGAGFLSAIPCALIGAFATHVVMSPPQGSPESLAWGLAGTAAGGLAGMVTGELWADSRYRSFDNSVIENAVASLSESGLLRRRAGRRRLRTLARLDAKAGKVRRARADLGQARARLATSTDPEPLLLAELDARAAEIDARIEAIQAEATEYAAGQLRAAFGDPEDVRRREDEAALSHAMGALRRARKA